jgi:hypothetical protein
MRRNQGGEVPLWEKGVIHGSFSGKQAAGLRFLRNSSSRVAPGMETRFQPELLRGAPYPGGRPLGTPACHTPPNCRQLGFGLG